MAPFLKLYRCTNQNINYPIVGSHRIRKDCDMNKLLLAISMIFFAVSVCSQTLTSKKWNEIRTSNDYIIGMGMSESMDQARLVAMSDLVGKISTKVESHFGYILSNKDNSESKAYMEKVIRTYSSVKLDNVSEYIEKDHGKHVVYRYMKNSDMRSMFKRRIDIAKGWAKEAEVREKEGKICDALQDYYWSLALLRSCPDGDLEFIEGNSNMVLSVYQKVKNILENITVKALSTEKVGYSQRLTLSIKYKGQPIANFNYKFSDGKRSSTVYSAKDGIGELLLPPNVKTKKLKILAEYEFRDEANIQPELQSVMENLDPVPFKSAIIPVDTRDCPLVSSSEYVMILPGSGEGGAFSESSQEPTYISTIRQIEKALAHKDYISIEQCFTAEGWDMFNKLIRYGDARLLRSPEVQFIPDGNRMVCRSFPMSFTFKGNKRTFKEDVVFYIDESNRVCEVAFGLEKAAVDDIMNRGQWSEEARCMMIHFLETYKTAYALKRLDYINTIFSQNALIITGSIVKGTNQKELSPAKMEHVKYTRQTKEQYMINLEKCFKSNEYINLHFADNVVRISNTNKNIYGIQIKQDYYSSTYGDTGYLFLLLNFENPETPIIHVRTWQPDNDPNVNYKDGRIGMGDFHGLEDL